MSSSPTSTTNSSQAQAAAKMPGDTIRALITLWLLFHLLGVGLALAMNPNAPVLPSNPNAEVRFNSKLVNVIKSAPLLSQYMYALWLDVPHDYWFSYGDLTDADHFIDLELVYPDGHKAQRRFPPEDARGEQRERYVALVRQIMAPIYSESTDNPLLAEIGQGLLQQSGASEAQFRITRHVPLSIEDAAAGDPGQHDPNNPRTKTVIYSGSVSLNSLGQGELHTQGQAARDVAPVTGPRSGPRNRNQSPPANNDSAPAPPSSIPGAAAAPSAKGQSKSALPLPDDIQGIITPPEPGK